LFITACSEKQCTRPLKEVQKSEFFSAWDGLDDDIPTETEPDGLAHSYSDIASSILIFTRADTSSKQNQP